MTDKPPKMTRTWHFLVLAVLCTAIVTGCSWQWQFDPFTDMRANTAQTESQTKEAPDQPHAVLAAARANRINLFGDIETGEEGTYFTRAAVSLKQHTFAEVGGDTDPDLDSMGRRLVFASTRHNTNPDLYIKSVDGVAVTQLTADPASDIQPAFSPDDTRVAFTSNRSGNWDIWIIGVNGDQPVQVTSGLADEVHPTWSPDGSRLVFCSLPTEGGQWELWIADATAGAVKRFVGYGLFPEWSPVDDTILFQRARERSSRWFSIWTISLVNGEPRYPTELAAGAYRAMILPAWSPDGHGVVFASTDVPPPSDTVLNTSAGTFDVWLMRSNGRAKVRLTDGHVPSYSPTFSPDGRIFFTSNRTGQENIWSVVPPGRAVTTLEIAPGHEGPVEEQGPPSPAEELETTAQTASTHDASWD